MSYRFLLLFLFSATLRTYLAPLASLSRLSGTLLSMPASPPQSLLAVPPALVGDIGVSEIEVADLAAPSVPPEVVPVGWRALRVAPVFVWLVSL